MPKNRCECTIHFFVMLLFEISFIKKCSVIFAPSLQVENGARDIREKNTCWNCSWMNKQFYTHWYMVVWHWCSLVTCQNKSTNNRFCVVLCHVHVTFLQFCIESSCLNFSTPSSRSAGQSSCQLPDPLAADLHPRPGGPGQVDCPPEGRQCGSYSR